MNSISISDYRDFETASKLVNQHSLALESQFFAKTNHCFNQVESERAKELHAFKNLSLHAPFKRLNPGSTIRFQLLETRRTFEQFFTIANSYNVSHAVFHTGLSEEESDIDSWIERSVLFWKVFLHSRDENFEIHLENTIESDATPLLEMLNMINSPKIKICLDVGHANCFSKRTVEEWIDDLGENIGSVHLHNNNGKEDEHNGIDDGTIDMDTVIQKLEEKAPNAVLTLETKAKMSSLYVLQQMTKVNQE